MVSESSLAVASLAGLRSRARGARAKWLSLIGAVFVCLAAAPWATAAAPTATTTTTPDAAGVSQYVESVPSAGGGSGGGSGSGGLGTGGVAGIVLGAVLLCGGAAYVVRSRLGGADRRPSG